MGMNQDYAYFGSLVSSMSFPPPPEIHTPVGNLTEMLC